MDTLAFETTEEILSNGVVIGIPLAGHALEELKVKQPLTVIESGVLDAPIRVEDQAGLGIAAPDSHIEGLKFKEVNKHQHKRALAFTARKLVRLLFRLLKDNRLYIPPEG